MFCVEHDTDRYSSQNLAQAELLWQKGCDLDEGSACALLGTMYHNGDGVTQDLAKAKSLFQKGCDLDDGLACRVLGTMYHNGNGVAQNLAKAHLRRSSCVRSHF